MMTKEDHAKTRTYRGKATPLKISEKHLTNEQLIERDIADIQNLFGTRYDKGIAQMRAYYGL